MRAAVARPKALELAFMAVICFASANGDATRGVIIDPAGNLCQSTIPQARKPETDLPSNLWSGEPVSLERGAASGRRPCIL